MRQLYKVEIQIREKIKELIDSTSLQTKKIAFYPPSHVVALMQGLGFSVTKDYVIRHYKEKGIRNENGLWVKDL